MKPYQTLYISGPMTGHKDLNFPAFMAVAAQLREMGYLIVNPAEIPQPDPHNYEMCLRVDMREMLAHADAVVTLAGWERSGGANKEVTLAEWTGIPVIPLSALIDDISA